MSDPGGGASRSTDPAAGTSTATDVSLREYLTALIAAAERRSDERFASMRASVDKAFESAQAAIEKAEEVSERRFEGVNEFRSTLSDQAREFVTKSTLEALISKLEAQIERNRDDLDNLSRRLDVREGLLPSNLEEKVDEQVALLRKDHTTLAQRIDVRDGEIKGSRLTYGNLAALLAGFATIVGLLVIAANYATSH